MKIVFKNKKEVIFEDKKTGKIYKSNEGEKLFLDNADSINKMEHFKGREKAIIATCLLNHISYKNSEINSIVESIENEDVIKKYSQKDPGSRRFRGVTSAENNKFKHGKLDSAKRCFENLERGVWCLTDFGFLTAKKLLSELDIYVYERFQA